MIYNRDEQRAVVRLYYLVLYDYGQNGCEYDSLPEGAPSDHVTAYGEILDTKLQERLNLVADVFSTTPERAEQILNEALWETGDMEAETINFTRMTPVYREALYRLRNPFA